MTVLASMRRAGHSMRTCYSMRRAGQLTCVGDGRFGFVAAQAVALRAARRRSEVLTRCRGRAVSLGAVGFFGLLRLGAGTRVASLLHQLGGLLHESGALADDGAEGLLAHFRHCIQLVLLVALVQDAGRRD